MRAVRAIDNPPPLNQVGDVVRWLAAEYQVIDTFNHDDLYQIFQTYILRPLQSIKTVDGLTLGSDR